MMDSEIMVTERKNENVLFPVDAAYWLCNPPGSEELRVYAD